MSTEVAMKNRKSRKSRNRLELVTLAVKNTGNRDVTRFGETFPRGSTATVRVPRSRAPELSAHVDLECEEVD
jgi:hypothetical protein